MRGYPQFSLWILIALAKISFFHIVLNPTKMPLTIVLVGKFLKKLEYLSGQMRDAQNVCTVTKGGIILKCLMNQCNEGVRYGVE